MPLRLAVPRIAARGRPSARHSLRAWLLEDSEDIEAAIRGEGDEEIDGLDRDESEEEDS